MDKVEKDLVNKAKLNSYEQGYLDACKDANMGKLKYKLIQNTDGSKTWQKCKDK